MKISPFKKTPITFRVYGHSVKIGVIDLQRHGFFITARKRSLRRLCFYRCLSVHRGGACMVAGGVHAWLLRGACVVAPGGACVVAPGGMHGCLRGGVHGFFDEIRSMSGQYASYWNAFLLKLYLPSYS